MRKSKFSEEQIIAILAEQERGMATAEVCRRHGVSSATFYKLTWSQQVLVATIADYGRPD